MVENFIKIIAIKSKKSSFLIALLFIQVVQSQTVYLQGIVKDSLNNELPYVCIIAKPVAEDLNMTALITDDKGRFNLELTQKMSYTISISHLGYNSYDFKYEALKNEQKDIYLKESVNELNEVVIKLPMIVKQDTIIYNTDKFVTGEEKKLKDILNKLPGIEVDENGEITSKGKVVTHTLVENKLFFGGNSKLAVENIPASAIEQVILLDNYNEVGFLKGLIDTDDLAINIKLKEKNKDFVFGDAEVGKDLKSHYKTHTNLFYYNPILSINFIGNVNNIGEKVFTFNDFINFQGGTTAAMNNKNYNQNLKDLSQFMSQKEVLKTEDKVGAFNISKAITKKFSVSSYGIYSNSTSQNKDVRINQYNIPNNSFTETINNKEKLDNNFLLAKFNSKYIVSDIEQGDLNISMQKANNNNHSEMVSVVNEQSNNIENLKDTNFMSIVGQLDWHKKISKSSTLSFNSTFSNEFNKPNSILKFDQINLLNFISFSPSNNFHLVSNKNIENRLFNVSLNHFYVLNKKVQLTTKIGHETRLDEFLTTDSQQLNDNVSVSFSNQGFNNDLNFKLNDTYAECSIRFKTTIFQFEPGISTHKYSWAVNQSTNIEKDKIVVLPSLIARIKVNRVDRIKLTYKLLSSFSEVSNFSNNYYINNYNHINLGNETIENELNHYASAVFTTSNLLRSTFFLSELTYFNKVKGLQNLFEISERSEISTLQMASFPSDSFYGTIIFNKKVKNVKYQISSRLGSFQNLEKINSIVVNSKGFNGSVKLSGKISLENLPAVEIGYKHSLNQYYSKNYNSKFSTYEPFLHFNYLHQKKLNIAFNYTCFMRQNNAINLRDSYNSSDLSIDYKKESSPWNFKIAVLNLLNESTKKQQSFNKYIISQSETYVLPRVVMLSVLYKF